MFFIVPSLRAVNRGRTVHYENEMYEHFSLLSVLVVLSGSVSLHIRPAKPTFQAFRANNLFSCKAVQWKIVATSISNQAWTRIITGERQQLAKLENIFVGLILYYITSNYRWVKRQNFWKPAIVATMRALCHYILPQWKWD